jgi:molybdate transport system substrate-binding protein
MDYVAERKLIKPDTRASFSATGWCSLPAQTADLAHDRSRHPLAQALGNNRLAMADPSAVPAGKYGKAALEARCVGLGRRQNCAGAGRAGGACSRLARRNRSALSIRPTRPPTKTSRLLPLSQVIAPPIIYPMAFASSTNGVAPVYVQYLLSPKARPFFEKRGFSVY